jgi:hypothetical protein
MAGARQGEVRVTLAIEGSTTRVAAVQLTRGKSVTAALLLSVLPQLVQDLTETLQRMKAREDHPAKGKPL